MFFFVQLLANLHTSFEQKTHLVQLEFNDAKDTWTHSRLRCSKRAGGEAQVAAHMNVMNVTEAQIHMQQWI